MDKLWRNRTRMTRIKRIGADIIIEILAFSLVFATLERKAFSRTLTIKVLNFWLIVIGLSFLAACGPSRKPAAVDEVAFSAATPLTPDVVIPAQTASPARPTLALVPTTRPQSNSPLPPPTNTPANPSTVPVYTYRIVNTYPHDRSAFTQGLLFTDGILYEGTGLLGQSSLRKVDLETGEVWQQYTLPLQFFGEGITIIGDRLIQLTWQSNVGFVYNKDSFALLDEFTYPTEGWGLTYDGQRLIMSDGTATLYFLSPDTYEEIGRVTARDQNGPVERLNELEYINGEVFANVWRSTRVARIDPQTGQVTGWIELDGLLTPEDRAQHVDVMNGIAYDAEGERLFVTGKWWPKLFEIEVLP